MRDFFRTLIRPDHEESPERAEIARAANLIQVGEFQILQLAYHDWHGHDLSPDAANLLFSTFMLDGQVPHWAHRYARKIFTRDATGTLNDHDPSYHRYDSDYHAHPQQGVGRFCIASAAVAATVFGGIWVSHLSVGEGTSYLPPYFEAKELTPRR